GGKVRGRRARAGGGNRLIAAGRGLCGVIPLCGPTRGWGALKQWVAAQEYSVTPPPPFVARTAPAARNIHAYWLAHRAPRERLRQLNKAPAPGRNDPCPCGSGKKFKRCHGAPDVALH